MRRITQVLVVVALAVVLTGCALATAARTIINDASKTSLSDSAVNFWWQVADPSLEGAATYFDEIFGSPPAEPGKK